MSAPTALLLTNGQVPPPPVLSRADAAGRLRAVDVYDLPGTELDGHPALLVTQHADQLLLLRLRDRLEAFLASGRRMVVCGQVREAFLACLSPYVPIPDHRPADLRVLRVREHPVFTGIATEDLTARRGVVGFYGRGDNPPPPGAVILHVLARESRPVDWLWRHPGGGEVLCHAGNDLWGMGAEDGTAARLPANLLDWALA